MFAEHGAPTLSTEPADPQPRARKPPRKRRSKAEIAAEKRQRRAAALAEGIRNEKIRLKHEAVIEQARAAKRARGPTPPLAPASPSEEARILRALKQRAGLIRAIGAAALFSFDPPQRVAIATGQDAWLAALRWIGTRSLEHARALIAHACLGMTFRAMGAEAGASGGSQQAIWRQACAAMIAVHQGRAPDDLVAPGEPDAFRWVDKIENHRTVLGGYTTRPVTLGVDKPVQHGHAVADLESIPDPDLYAPGDDAPPEKRVSVFRTRDNIATLQHAGTIDRAQARTAERFRRDFRAAGFDPLRATNAIGGGGGGKPGAETEARIEARLRVAGILDRCGGRSCVAAIVLWHVCGEGRTLAEAAAVRLWGSPGRRDGGRSGPGPKQRDHRRIGGALAAALDVAGAFYAEIDEERRKRREHGGA